MLNEIIADGSIKSRGIVGFYRANSVNDDIYIYESEQRTTPSSVLYGLRQQGLIESQSSYQCISDFVAPLDSGKSDYVGMFAVSSGFGCEELCAK
jgi:5-methyltetrahydrofolate--homocysteine methyltransferase